MKSVLSGFKEFILRGSVLDLAVGIVIGAAFSQVVNSIVDNFISPLVGLIFGEPNFNHALVLTIGKTQFMFGAILTDIINLLTIGAAVYFCVVLPMNKLAAKRSSGAVEEEAAPEADVALLTEIRDLLATQKRD